jgi:hypothetical protein
MWVLKGFTTTLAKTTTNAFPFGLWFANAHTLYVADEGSDTTTFAGGQYTAAAAQTTAGLQKWVFDGLRNITGRVSARDLGGRAAGHGPPGAMARWAAWDLTTVTRS